MAGGWGGREGGRVDGRRKGGGGGGREEAKELNKDRAGTNQREVETGQSVVHSSNLIYLMDPPPLLFRLKLYW